MPRKKQSKESAKPQPRWLYGLGWIIVILIMAVLVGWYLAIARQATGELGLPLDDGWIHARFAQNLARGEGFSFNPGEGTSTTTGPLWTLLLALGYWVTGEHLVTGIALNFVLAIALSIIVYLIIWDFSGSKGLSLATAFVVTVTAPLPWWILSGMEPPLYAVFALLGILLQVRSREWSGIRAIAPTVAFAMAGLARPEMMLLFPLAMLDRWLSRKRTQTEKGKGGSLKEMAIHAAVFTALVAPFFLYNFAVTGYWLPTSFYSKMQRLGIPGALADPRVSLIEAVFVGPWKMLAGLWRIWWWNNGLLALILPVGFGGAVWKARRGEGSGSYLIPLVLVAQPVIWAWVAGYRPPEYQSQRYIANLNPLFVILAMAGGWWLVERIGATRRVAVKIALVAIVAALSLGRQPETARVYALNVKNTNEMQVNIGRWLSDNAPQDSLLAVNDIGAIAHFSDMRVLDLQGLVTPEILPLRSIERMVDGTAPQAVLEFIAEHEPDYLIIFPQWYPDLHQRRDLFRPIYEVQLKDNITNGAPWMVVYRTVWAEGSGEVGDESG